MVAVARRRRPKHMTIPPLHVTCMSKKKVGSSKDSLLSSLRVSQESCTCRRSLYYKGLETTVVLQHKSVIKAIARARVGERVYCLFRTAYSGKDGGETNRYTLSETGFPA